MSSFPKITMGVNTGEIAGFCEAVRVGKPVACGPERAMHSARACIMANEAVARKGPLTT